MINNTPTKTITCYSNGSLQKSNCEADIQSQPITMKISYKKHTPDSPSTAMFSKQNFSNQGRLPLSQHRGMQRHHHIHIDKQLLRFSGTLDTHHQEQNSTKVLLSCQPHCSKQPSGIVIDSCPHCNWTVGNEQADELAKL